MPTPLRKPVPTSRPRRVCSPIRETTVIAVEHRLADEGAALAVGRTPAAPFRSAARGGEVITTTPVARSMAVPRRSARHYRSAGRARSHSWCRRAAAAPQLAATRRPFREPKRSRGSRTVTSVRRTACPCTAASVLARDRRLSKRLRPPSGLSWAATTASTGRLVSTASNRPAPTRPAIAFLARPPRGGPSVWRHLDAAASVARRRTMPG